MVNGAPGSAWASLRIARGGDESLTIIGTPAHDDPSPLTAGHLFDLASLTKVFTTVVALRLVDDGRLNLDAPVREVMSVGSGEGAAQITLRQLLTHTSGLPAEGRMWRDGRRADALREAVLASTLLSEPASAHRYSDVGFVAVGSIVERVSGRSLDELVAVVADALGADSLTFAPDGESSVATEVQPHRGLVRGEVHDELAHALGRPSGHAGLFGTVHDVAALARMLRDEGMGARARVLSAECVALMTVPAVRADAGYGQAVGLRVRDAAWMGDVDAAGHTGFTGTAFAVHRATGAVGVLLTNRVHPTREGADIAPARRLFFGRLDG